MARSEYEKLDRPESDDEHTDGHDDAIPRTSEDVRRHDRETLDAEEEAERLLTGNETASPRTPRKGKRRRLEGEKRELLYDTEEGGRASSAESSGHSSEVDLARLGETQARRKTRRGREFCTWLVVHVLIVGAFVALLYAAWRASQGHKHGKGGSGDMPEVAAPAPGDDKAEQGYDATYTPQTLSNGTHIFGPTTLLISLDGFRADFLHRGLTPHLSALVRGGVSPKYMLPSFPSLTFPNHFTLVTGLHPESHGVVGNTFWDPTLEREFYYTDPARSMQAEWWDAEPIWATAEKSGVRTGVHMWPGSEVKGGIGGVEASYVDEFDGEERLDNKVKKILAWLDLPGSLDVPGVGVGGAAKVHRQEVRPQLIAAYVPDVDADGHLYGPNSTYIRSTIAEVDSMIGLLLHGLDERNLTNIVNIVVVSDHGMATTSVNRLIQLEDLIDTTLIEHIDGWPLYGLRPFDSSEGKVKQLYVNLLWKAKQPQYLNTFDVYLRDVDMPERYHFSGNERIAPLWIVPKAGWAIVTREEFDVQAGVANGEVYHPRGLHGYDNAHTLMRAIFLARGPAFPHVPGSELAPFQNTEVYNIVCDSLGLKPVPNNGTLRLPLKPSGLHDFDKAVEVPEDFQDDPELALPPEVPNLAFGPHGQTEEMKAAASEKGEAMPWLANRPDFVVPTGVVPSVEPTAAGEAGVDFIPHDGGGPTRPEQIGQPHKPVQDDKLSGGSGTDEDDGEDAKAEEKEGQWWWDWVTSKFEAAKGWAVGLFEGNEEEEEGGGEGS